MPFPFKCIVFDSAILKLLIAHHDKWLPPITIQKYYKIIHFVFCALLFIFVTYVFYKWEVTPLNLLYFTHSLHTSALWQPVVLCI